MRLEAEQVTKQYQMDPRKARFAYALSGTDLVVEEGEFAVITGKSGSGKSTLLHILAGLLQPTSGCVLAGGKDLYRMADSELSKFRNENIAVIPQGGGAIYSLTAEENIRLARNIYGKKEEKDILPVMRELGIELLKDAYPSELSGGELRRVAIAGALCRDTGIFLPMSRHPILMKRIRISLQSSSAGRQIAGKRFLSSLTRRTYYPMPIPTTL